MSTTESIPIPCSVTAVHQYFNQPSLASIWQPLSSIKDVTVVEGGSTNLTFRLHFAPPFEALDTTRLISVPHSTAICKFFPNNIALTPHISFSSNRQSFEARALADLAQHLGSPASDPVQIALPTLLCADSTRHFIITEDLCPNSGLKRPNNESSIKCKQLVRQTGQDPFENQVGLDVARALGSWLFKLHSLGQNPQLQLRERFDHEQSRQIVALTAMGDFMRCVGQLGIRLDTDEEKKVEAILKQFGDNLLGSSHTDTLVMGDFWMGNLMVRLTGNDAGQSSLHDPAEFVGHQEGDSTGHHRDFISDPGILVHVIDWEFATFALPYVDLAHFAAEAWLLDFFDRESDSEGTLARSMTEALFNAYSRAGGLIDFQSIIVYIAGHVGCFMHYTTHWTKDEDLKRTAAMQAVEMIQAAGDENWEALSKDPFLGVLLPLELVGKDSN